MIKNKYILRKLFAAIFLLLILPCLLFSQQRKIKPGDAIEIVVYDHEELSRTVIVSPQGTVDFPFIQNIAVDGLTLAKMQEVIVAQLTRYLTTPPIVTVSYAKATAMAVNVLGMVGKPGIVKLPLDSRLQGAIEEARKIMPGANMKAITLLREENGLFNSTNYNLELFILNGDLKQNPVLSDKDIVIVTGNPIFAQVKVLGSVNMPGTYNPLHGASVVDMIFMAGGFAEDADPSKIKYISLSKEESTELEFDLSKYYKTPQSYANLPTVKEGDIIIIPKKKKSILIVSWGVMKEILSLGQLVYWIYLIRQYK